MKNKNLITARSEHIFAVIGREEIQSEPFNNVIEFDNVKEFPSDLVFISISDPRKQFIKTDNYFHDELKLKFWDVEEQIGNYFPINKVQAKEIKDFILKHRDRKFLINCEAGVSRSAGVGCAVEFLLRDKELFPEEQHHTSRIRQHWRYDVNETVYRLILDA